MAMLAQSFSFSNPPHRFILDAQFLSPSSPLSVSSPKFSTLSSRLLGNGNWVRQRNIIFQAKSADPDAEAGSSRQKDAVSSSPSTSFLSVLCPLLKLFSVRFSNLFLCLFVCTIKFDFSLTHGKYNGRGP